MAMIVYDLKCDKGHVFEAWFPDSGAFKRQRKRGQVTCPACGETKVEKALMAPNINSSRKKDAEQEVRQAAQMVQALGKLRQHIEANCDYVGPKFAEEALKIHYGESEKRDIYGEATAADAENLREEGVEFSRVPWLPRADN